MGNRKISSGIILTLAVGGTLLFAACSSGTTSTAESTPVVIEKEVKVEVPVEVIKEVEVVKEVKVPVEVIKEVEVVKEVIKEVPLTVIKEVEKQVRVEVPVETIKEVEIVKEVEVVKEVKVPVEVIKEVEVVKEVIVEVKPTPTGVTAGLVVTLDPQNVEVGIGNTSEVSIIIDPQKHGVSAGEIQVDYNPSLLQVTSIVPGDLLGPNIIAGLKSINNVSGTVKFAIARVGETTVPTKPGTLAKLSIRVPSGAKAGNGHIELTRAVFTNHAFKDIGQVSVLDGEIQAK